MLRLARIPPTWELAVLMAAADNVFGVNNLILCLPTGCLGWDLGLNFVSSSEFSYLLIHRLFI